MIIIAHRINTISALKNLSFKYGVEVDIRSRGKKIIIHHDPFKEGESFFKWIKYFNHKFLILNVKEEGLENKLIDCMKKNNITNYFFLDQSFPFLIKFSNLGFKNCAARVSEFEKINTVLTLKGKINWIWVDYFSEFPLNKKNYSILKNANFNICLVSPELHGRNPDKEIPKLKKLIVKLNFKFDAVCTKRPELWEI